MKNFSMCTAIGFCFGLLIIFPHPRLNTSPFDLFLEGLLPVDKYSFLALCTLMGAVFGFYNSLQKKSLNTQEENKDRREKKFIPLTNHENIQLSNEILKARKALQKENKLTVRFNRLLSGVMAFLFGFFPIFVSIGAILSKDLWIFYGTAIIGIFTFLGTYLFFRRKKYWLMPDGKLMINNFLSKNKIIDLKNVQFSLKKQIIESHRKFSVTRFLQMKGVFKENDNIIQIFYFKVSAENFENSVNNFYENNITLGSLLLFIEENFTSPPPPI